MLVIGDSLSPHLQKWVGSYKKRYKSVTVLTDTYSVNGQRGGRQFLTAIKFIGVFFSVIFYRLFTSREFHLHYVSRYSLFSYFIPKSRLVSYAWGSDVQKAPNHSTVLKSMILHCLNKSKLVVVSSASLSKTLEKLRIKTNVIEVPFGISRSSLSTEPRCFDHESTHVVNIGCFKYCRYELYGFDVLRRFAFRLSEQTKFKIRLHIISAGPDKERLVESFTNLDANIEVVFWPEVNDHNRMIQLIQQVDFTCYFSRRESFGVCVLESMAQGVPVVAAPVGGILGLIDDGADGCLCDDTNLDKGVEWLLALCSSPDLYRQHSERCIKRVSEKFIWEANFADFLKEINSTH